MLSKRKERKYQMIGRKKVLNNPKKLTVSLDERARFILDKLAKDSNRSLSYIVNELIMKESK